MRMGSKSVLFGVHQFLIHPIFVAIAWTQIFGVPWDPRLWVAFFVHDIGYIGKSDMDGPEGEAHVVFGHKIMLYFGFNWGKMCLYHSRFWAKRYDMPISSLCIADKWAMLIQPTWMYLIMARATGEIREYRNIAKHIEDSGIELEGTSWASDKEWCDRLRDHMINWTYEQILNDNYDAFPFKSHKAVLPYRRPR